MRGWHGICKSSTIQSSPGRQHPIRPFSSPSTSLSLHSPIVLCHACHQTPAALEACPQQQTRLLQCSHHCRQQRLQPQPIILPSTLAKFAASQDLISPVGVLVASPTAVALVLSRPAAAARHSCPCSQSATRHPLPLRSSIPATPMCRRYVGKKLRQTCRGYLSHPWWRWRASPPLPLTRMRTLRNALSVGHKPLTLASCMAILFIGAFAVIAQR
jgi:hypothetical protein